ncbi:MAG TPA: hypothetical protein ENH82_18115, partial [bacterium]|nr:hypothetical protein [bacterium]
MKTEKEVKIAQNLKKKAVFTGISFYWVLLLLVTTTCATKQYTATTNSSITDFTPQELSLSEMQQEQNKVTPSNLSLHVEGDTLSI